MAGLRSDRWWLKWARGVRSGWVRVDLGLGLGV